ncbi:helix-turn-helix domain-containing protein [Paractinoplanes ferrugineus]
MTPPDPIKVVEARRFLADCDPVQIRVNAGLSKAELARLVGVTPAAISLLEAGLRRPWGRTAVAWADALVRIQLAGRPASSRTAA